jgi:transmembrane protein 17
MDEVAKQTLKQVGETIFPGISESYHSKSSKNRTSKSPMSKLGNEIVTDLPLQMCLFFNCCYFPFWLIISIVIAYVKYEYLNYLYKFILVTILVATTIIEITRLYLGFLGNLTEKVPELAGFWLLTVLLQFPMQVISLLRNFLGLYLATYFTQSQ